MTSDKILREHLIELLTEPNAHITFRDVMSDFPLGSRGRSFAPFKRTAWELLEHLRICQWDIIEFSYDPRHVSPEFPEGYWPENPEPPTDIAWENSVEQFQNDLSRFLKLINNESTDLLATIGHGDGQTVFREALVLAKHNSYHLGQLVLLKQLCLTG